MIGLAWICGIAESWAPFFWVGGARGFTSGLMNVAPALAVGYGTGAGPRDYGTAMQIWHQIKPFEDLRARRNNGNNVSAVKEAMAQLGLCEATVRPPISELADKNRAEVRQILQQLGVEARSAAVNSG